MNKAPSRHLIIIDEVFEKTEGHPYAYDKSVVEIFEQEGFKTTIYGHKNMLPAFVDELGAKPWSTINTKAKVRKIPVLGAILYRAGFLRKHQQEIKDILAKEQPGAEALVFFPNVYWYNILSIAMALKGRDVHAALLYRISIFDTVGVPAAFKSVTLRLLDRAVKLLHNNKNVHFFTDSEVIANEWTGRYKGEMKVLPIPHLEPNTAMALPRDADKVRMYLPGGMRIEKGAQVLTEAFELLAKTEPELLKKIILVTQFTGGHELLESYKARLAALPLTNEFLKHLTTEEYNRQMGSADVVLIPYQVSEGYRARTSGVLAEAIASSRPFITTDGTWMSLQAKKYDTGMIVPDGDPQALASAIINITKDHSAYSSRAANARDKWMESQSKEVFYQALVSAMK